VAELQLHIGSAQARIGSSGSAVATAGDPADWDVMFADVHHWTCAVFLEEHRAGIRER
jgi:hypothetical protein